jgi:mycothiol synthase
MGGSREFHRRGKQRVGLGVDAESLTGATRLYLKAEMQPDSRRQWSLFEKELRPGFEISTQAVK